MVRANSARQASVCGDAAVRDRGGGIRYGDYFTAARNFLEQDGFEIITHAVAQHTRRDITSEAIEKIRIILEKHGEFYHPARIETVLAETTLSFVLNVAVTDIGKALCKQRVSIIKTAQHTISIFISAQSLWPGPHLYPKRKIGNKNVFRRVV